MSVEFNYELDFLWFSYFGISRQDAFNNRDEALRRCCVRAYLDLSRTLDFTHSASELDSKIWKTQYASRRSEYLKIKDHFKEQAGELICRECVSAPQDEDAFDKWHYDLCKKIISLAKDEGDLFSTLPTYGHCQKWVNMTLKNMLLMGIFGTDKLKPCLHVPLDTYIFRAAKRDLKIVCPFGTWSGIPLPERYEPETNRYLIYQKSIKKAVFKKYGCCPIDWEGPEWIREAMLDKANKSL